MLLGYRVVMFVAFWKIPLSLAANRFFGFPIPASDAQPLLHRYRARLLVVYLVDVCCAVAAFFWAGLAGLVVEQAVAAILARVTPSLVGILFFRQAKWLADQDSWKPVRSVALLLKPRRLRDHTNLFFELILALLTVGSLVLLVFRYAEEGELLTGQARYGILA